MPRLEDGPEGKPMLTVTSAADLREWLAAEHTRPGGVWLVRSRPGFDVDAVDYEHVINELLCFGWIDAVIKTLDERRSVLWISPRRKGSVWSKPNKERIERLLAVGRVQPPGLAVIDRAKQDGSWTVIDGPEKLEVPDDLDAALAADPDAQARFAAFPASVRKAYLTQIALAKSEATRQRRIADTVERSARNQRPGS